VQAHQDVSLSLHNEMQLNPLRCINFVKRWLICWVCRKQPLRLYCFSKAKRRAITKLGGSGLGEQKNEKQI